MNPIVQRENGSRDQFANPQRTRDPARTFIKTFVQTGVIGGVVAFVLTEEDLRQSLEYLMLFSKLDRGNVEKLLSIARSVLRFLVA